ncbi:MAG: hypothetical protein MUE52_05405 [Tabrizicola sp.]|jgi:hypothetical protein|nr:hypothetical protein [Tabrizicola sp.]
MSDLTSADIERSLDDERKALAATLAALRDRVAPRALVSDGKALMAAQAGPVLDRLDRTVRAQPLVAAVAGVAIVALLFGRQRTTTEPEASALAGTRFEALTRWEDEGGPPAPEPVDLEEDWLAEAMGLREKAQRLFTWIDDAARRGLAPLADLAEHRAAVGAALAQDTTRALYKGLGSVAGAARERALQTRERILLNRIALAERSGAMVKARPLATGLSLAAAGAALAWLCPPTETEDRLLGEARDRMVADLKRLPRTEALKASAVARSLSEALQTDLSWLGNAIAPVPPVTDSGPGAWRH